MDYKALRKYIIYVAVGAATLGFAGHETADIAADHFNFSAVSEYTLEGILTATGIIIGAKSGSWVYDITDHYNRKNKK